MKYFNIMLIVILMITAGCTKKDSDGTKDNVTVSNTVIVATGYGESKDKAFEDAKHDALRQYGYRVIDNKGEPKLIFAGEIVEIKKLNEYSEQLQNGTWWEIKVRAEIRKL